MTEPGLAIGTLSPRSGCSVPAIGHLEEVRSMVILFEDGEPAWQLKRG